MKRTAVALVLFAAACSSAHAKPAGRVAPLPTSALPSCASVFMDGAVIPTTITGGCLNTQGDRYVPGTFDCRDGSKLLGDSRGWGIVGKAMHAQAAASDPAYAKAYRACTA